MSMQQAEREFRLWCYRLMHWGLHISDVDSHLISQFSWRKPSVGLHRMCFLVTFISLFAIMKWKFLQRRVWMSRKRSVKFQTDCSSGVVQVSRDRRHKWSHTTNPQALLLYISASLSSCLPQHPLGYFWPLMELDWRLVTNVSSHLCHLCSAEPPAGCCSVA